MNGFRIETIVVQISELIHIEISSLDFHTQEIESAKLRHFRPHVKNGNGVSTRFEAFH